MEYLSHGETETEALGASLAETLEPGAVLALRGGLGAGKTAFVRGLAAGLGCPGRVTSPTFTIVNEYEGGRLPLFHFDMYRLSGEEELFAIGWDEYLSRGGVCAVEWSERVEDALPEDTIIITLERIGDSGSRDNVDGGSGHNVEGSSAYNEDGSSGFSGDSNSRRIRIDHGEAGETP